MILCTFNLVSKCFIEFLQLFSSLVCVVLDICNAQKYFHIHLQLREEHTELRQTVKFGQLCERRRKDGRFGQLWKRQRSKPEHQEKILLLSPSPKQQQQQQNGAMVKILVFRRITAEVV